MSGLRINDEPVDPALIDDAFQRIKAEVESQTGLSCCERDEEFMERAREEVIDSILLAQEAERRVPSPSSDEIRKALEATLQEWRQHGASWEMLETRKDELREETAARLRMDRFAQAVWADLPQPDPETLRVWLEEHGPRFRRPAQARVRHLVRFPGNDPAEEYRTLQSLRRRALEGEDFASMAERHTAREDRRTDLGWITQERVLDGFEALLFSLREGEISPIFHYEQSLHLVRIEKLIPEHIPPFEEIENEVRQAYLGDQKQAAMHDLAKSLRRDAVIDVL
jgi:parvulin-like peptidyl-prolyl isomerase